MQPVLYIIMIVDNSDNDKDTPATASSPSVLGRLSWTVSCARVGIFNNPGCFRQLHQQHFGHDNGDDDDRLPSSVAGRPPICTQCTGRKPIQLPQCPGSAERSGSYLQWVRGTGCICLQQGRNGATGIQQHSIHPPPPVPNPGLDQPEHSLQCR